MTKDELTNFLIERIGFVADSIEDYGDRDELIEDAASGGNHDDTFSLGETYGYYDGQLRAFQTILEILEETPEVVEQSN